MTHDLGPLLVTGGTGFVGRHLVDLLLRHGYSVAAASVPGDPLWDLVPDEVTRLAFDILDADAVAAALEDLRPHAVFHLAGLARGQDLQRMLAVNVMGTDCVLRGAAKLETPPKVVIPGSAAEYGIIAEGEPAAESAALNPISPYGLSKVAQSLLGVSYARRGEVPVVVGRIFNITGPREPATMLIGSLANQIGAIEAGQQPPVVRVGNLDPYRDYLDLRDAVRALWLLWRHGESGQVYNICSGEARQVSDVVRRIVALSAVPIDIVPDPERQRPSDIPYCAGVADRLRDATGWQPEISLDESLSDTLSWWREAHKSLS